MSVRWDAVVQDQGFWSEAPRPTPPAHAVEGNRRVQVWLFGSLGDGVSERPISVECRGAFSIDDVIAELGRLYGRPFLDRVTDSGGRVLRNCRIFANGLPVDDARTPIQPDASQTDIELILLTAAEGG